jgi:hypothetical protein
MPVHDWTRVEAGTFHAFHGYWNGHLMDALNSGLLPPDHYALAVQVVSRRRRVVVRQITGHRVVAVIEVASPANKDVRDSVRELVEKVCQLLEAGIHVLLVDLLPPRKHDPQGCTPPSGVSSIRLATNLPTTSRSPWRRTAGAERNLRSSCSLSAWGRR